MKKKRCLIFGSNGFIAKNFASNNQINKNFNILKFNKKKLNLTKDSSISLLNRFIKKGDYILFLAAEAPCKNFKQLHNNIKMITNFLTVINNKNISYLSYVSSDAVYKDTKKKINEESAVDSDSYHGIMHTIREELLTKLYKGKLSIFRPTLIFGPDDPHNGYGPNQFIRLILNGKKITLFGEGEERRDHVHIESVVSILSHAFSNKSTGTYNIASGKVVSFLNIAKQIEKISSKKNIIKKTKRSGPLHHLGLRQFDIKKINKIFGPNNPTNIIDYLENYRLDQYKT